jgi:hypothetical protein
MPLAATTYREEEAHVPRARVDLMTREQFAEKIRWPIIFAFIGFVNVIAMVPQLWQIITTREVGGISLTTYAIYWGIQVGFGVDGFFKRNNTMVASLMMTTSIITSVLYLRYHAG